MAPHFFDQCSFIDIHYHADPDLYKRRYSSIDVGREYQKLNGAVVLKSHLGSTAAQATIAQREGLPVFPSLVLNKIAGGIHYRPIIRALAEYQPIIPSKMIIHLPTMTGRKHTSKLSRQLTSPLLSGELCQPETIFNADGKLKSELDDIFKLAKDYPIVLSSGHASKEEVFALIDACGQFDVPLLLNQPANPLTGLSAAALMEIAQTYPFVWTEQTALTYLLSYQDQQDFRSVLQTIPQVIYSSDLGQTSQMDVTEWVTASDQWFSDFSISTTRKAEICLTNPSQLLKM
ncbi:DUF6282 family protein [Aquicella lusitana]|uniref:Amidohydrolase family protein n=1 Tax=Aquicella lusitana TaxID=254246 RepID=A0A370G3J4_9COXI|nr:DUF6282 family protein [Aquicella lusitana]RDI37586.1 hypothetical protein C8D86_1378 [Aquicella lusitana]VVC73903.1 hypothetical protein AQULUS_16580 [Aquicella lusitana]